MAKRGRPPKPKRKRGRPQGSGIVRVDLGNEIRKAWRDYYHLVQKPKKKRKK